MKTSEFKNEKQILRIMIFIIISGMLLYFYNENYQPITVNFWLYLLGELIYFFCGIYFIGTLFIHWKASAFINKKFKWELFIITILASSFYLFGFLLYYIFVYELKLGICKNENKKKSIIPQSEKKKSVSVH